MDTINRQTEELARLRDALAERESTLAVAQADNSELQLRASTTKNHCIMFGDAWIIETTHHRLKGPLPLDREGASLLAVPGALLNCSIYSVIYSLVDAVLISDSLDIPKH